MRFIVKVKGETKGEAEKHKTRWRFKPADDVDRTPFYATCRSLKDLSNLIAKTYSVLEGDVKFTDAPSPIKIKIKGRKRAQVPKRRLSKEEWMALERKSTKYSPRQSSIECRSTESRRGRSVPGGLPGLGKRH